MKVLFVSSGKEDGSPGPIVKAQAASIQEMGIFASHFTVKRKGFYGYLLAFRQLSSLLKREKFDIIHAHYGLTGVISLLARSKEKLVVSFMGDDIVGSRKQDGSITKFSLIVARINKWLASRFYDFSIVKSPEMSNKLRISYSMVIPNGVNTGIFNHVDREVARRKLNIPLNSKVTLFLSNPARSEKNYPLACNAVQLLKDMDVNLLTVTDKMHGELADYYNAADVLLLSSFHEGSPNVIKEAMACNCPIVSTNVGDVEWVFGNTEGCYLASFDPVDFAEKLKLALTFAHEKGRTQGRERIIELGLDSANIAWRIIQVYKKVLEE